MSVNIGKFESALEIAKRIFGGTKYHASDEKIKKLAENMILLEQRGLNKLNQNLINNRKKIWDFFAEHNFAIKLLSHLNEDIPISYEPHPGFRRRPIDFKIELGDITYWVQMKKLSTLERENRQDKIIQQIKRETTRINIGKFFSIKLSENFTEADVAGFLKFLEKSANNSEEGVEYVFPDTNQRKAIVEFWSPKNVKPPHLTLRISSDADIVEITGSADNQIRGSLLNAAGAFKWNVDEKNINLVVMDAYRYHDRNICNAVFGTEFLILNSNNPNIFFNRNNDGFFQQCEFSNRVAGVIAMRRKAKEPISDCYFFALYKQSI